MALALSFWAPGIESGNCYAERPLGAGESYRWLFVFNTASGRGNPPSATTFDVYGTIPSGCTFRVDLLSRTSLQPIYSQTFVDPSQGHVGISLNGVWWGGWAGAADVTVLSGSITLESLHATQVDTIGTFPDAFYTIGSANIQPVAVPEPQVIAIALFGVTGLLLRRGSLLFREVPCGASATSFLL